MLELETGLLFLFGLAIFGGILSALLFKKIKYPRCWDILQWDFS